MAAIPNKLMAAFSKLDAFKQRVFHFSMREKVLFLLVMLTLVFFWLTNQIDRHKSTFASIESANRIARNQGEWFMSEPEIRQRYEAAIAAINLEELPTQDEVAGQIDDIVRKHIPNFRSPTSTSEYGSPLSFYTWTLDITKSEYKPLIYLVEDLKRNLPYVSVRRMTIRSLPSNDDFVYARIELKSIEYTP